MKAVGGGMTRAPRRTLLALAVVAVALVATTGCAARWAYRQAEDAVARGNWDLAVARYTGRSRRTPRTSATRSRSRTRAIQASRFHYDEARKAPGRRATSRRRPTSWRSRPSTTPPTARPPTTWRSCATRIRKREDEQQRAAPTSSQTKARAQAARVPAARALAAQPGAHHDEASRTRSLQKILETPRQARRRQHRCSTRASATRRPPCNLSGRHLPGGARPASPS